tara:strand:+ start:2406 stop:2549 length:144 start_codon:yes stop_codon:yes gene_type:complete
MKKIFFTLFFLLFSCEKSSVNWYQGTFQSALESDIEKIIMVDFYADW